jgi:hypothetical protein
VAVVEDLLESLLGLPAGDGELLLALADLSRFAQGLGEEGLEEGGVAGGSASIRRQALRRGRDERRSWLPVHGADGPDAGPSEGGRRDCAHALPGTRFAPRVEELPAATPDRRVLVFIMPATDQAHMVRELRNADRIHLLGATKAARWFPGSEHP